MRDIVADLCSDEPTLTPWWVLVLTEWLPDDGAYFASVMAAAKPGVPGAAAAEHPLHLQHYGWGTTRHLLAALFDALQVNTVVTAKVAGAKKVNNPPTWPRPGSKPRVGGGGAVPITALMPRRRPKPGGR